MKSVWRQSSIKRAAVVEILRGFGHFSLYGRKQHQPAPIPAIYQDAGNRAENRKQDVSKKSRTGLKLSRRQQGKACHSRVGHRDKLTELDDGKGLHSIQAVEFIQHRDLFHNKK
jgi:hypothetical protein